MDGHLVQKTFEGTKKKPVNVFLLNDSITKSLFKTTGVTFYF